MVDLRTSQQWPLHRPNAIKNLGDLGERRFNVAFGQVVKPLSDAFISTHGISLSKTLRRHEESRDLRVAATARAHLEKKIGRQFVKQHEAMLGERAVMTVWGNRMSLRRYASGRMANYFEARMLCERGGEGGGRACAQGREGSSSSLGFALG